MRKFNLELCQQLLNQTRSIDESARLMNDHGNKTLGFYYWQGQIIKHVNKGDLKI